VSSPDRSSPDQSSPGSPGAASTEAQAHEAAAGEGSAATPPEARIEALRRQVNASLAEVAASSEPEELYDPVRYVLEGGGKRLRPVLLLLVVQAYGRSSEAAMPAALAAEVFHNFTLVHDDIMDHADARRGRPTVHVEWDQSTAILTGDMLMALSYDLLTRLDGSVLQDGVALQDLMRVYHRMVEQLCRGQALDKAYETRRDVSVDAYLDMIDSKTGALLTAVFELGGLIGAGAAADRETLRRAGRLIGRAFQIQDDLLDLTADSDAWGKTIGGDLMEGKKTFITLRALEEAEGDEYEWFARLHEGGLPSRDIDEARDRMARLGVFDDAETAVQTYSDDARSALGVLPDGPARTTLRWLVERMASRVH
jgi:geranylgeranyl diphosphate synthase type II